MSQRPQSLPALCQKCGERGPVPLGDRGERIPWCKCPKGQGPFVAPPGHVTMFIVQTPDEAAFAERCRLASNAERQARDDLAGIWVGFNRGGKRHVRQLAEGHPKRVRLEQAYDGALAKLEALQSECRHPFRSLFNSSACGCCHVDLGPVSAEAAE